MRALLIASFLCFDFFPMDALAQKDSLNENRLALVVTGESVLFASSVAILASTWYKDQSTTKFHFFNDNSDWLQMDKAGHAVTSFFVGSLGIDALKWAGVEHQKAVWYGGGLGLIYLTSIEIMDGFSEDYGASSGDMISNAIGSALLIGQELYFKDRPLIFKYSFQRTSYAKYRPELLGSSLAEEMLKDYNGQTYWVSLRINSMLNNKEIPSWLNLAFGYGAEGMTGGKANPVRNGEGEYIPDFKRYRQYYLSLDVNLNKIKTRSKFLKTAFRTLNFVKIPFPALEYNAEKGFVFHPLYF